MLKTKLSLGIKELKNNDVVVIVGSNVSANNCGPTEKATEKIVSAIKYLCNHVEVLEFDSYTKNIEKYKEYVIFCISTSYSPYHENVYPAIFCEVNNIKSANNGSFANFISTDKEIFKLLCKEYNVHTPSYIKFRPCTFDINLLQLDTEDFPYIVKESRGFESKNLKVVENIYELIEFVHNIPEELQNDSFIIEEYIDGDDIHFSIFGDNNKIDLYYEETVEISSDVNEKYKILSNELKHDRPETRRKYTSDKIKQKDKENLFNLFKSIDGIKYTRLDCRFGKSSKDESKKLYVFESNSLASINQNSTCFKAFEKEGFSYVEFIAYLLLNA